MSENLLANALGKVCAQQSGLYKFVLPRSLRSSFKHALVNSLRENDAVAVPIGDGEDEYSAGEAIAFRTPEDSSNAKAIVLVVSEGQQRELKSLETFRDVLTGGMPGGLEGSTSAIVSVDSLASRISEQVAQGGAIRAQTSRLYDALEYVITFLALAYREAGNDEKRWTDAFWLHLDRLSNQIPAAISSLPPGLPSYERDAVFASAGLPRPDGPNFYASKNNHQQYAKVVAKGWISQEDIDRSLNTIDIVDGDSNGRHPILAIDWAHIVTSRAVFGHPLLTVAYHGSSGGGTPKWLNGWASTSERAFFQERQAEEPSYQLFVSHQSGEKTELTALDWQGVDHVLPQQTPDLRDGRLLCLGNFELRLGVDIGSGMGNPPIELFVKPSNAAIAEIRGCSASEGEVVISFELLRRIPKSGGKWREKPFTLSIAPTRIDPGSRFLTPLSLKLLAPHPSRPSAVALEQLRGRGKLSPSFATDERYHIDAASGTIISDTEVDELPLLKLRDGSVPTKLAVIGAQSNPTLVGGSELPKRSTDGEDLSFTFFELSSLPANPVVEIDSYQVSIEIPEIEKGRVNPLFAAICGEPVISIDDELKKELLTDPRGLLEEWYMGNCISNGPSREVRSSLGTCVVEASGRGQKDLSFSETIQAYTNTSPTINLRFPTQLAESDEGKEFWQAFDALGLHQFGGVKEESLWPSALDLRDLASEKVDSYLQAFASLLESIDEPRANSWAAYPFSVLLYNQQRGQPEGVLLSPLHPIRLAWSWSVQNAGDELVNNEIYDNVASSFLRFVDGELLPLSGPATRGNERWIATGLSPGPQEFFAGWTLLAGHGLRENHSGRSVKLLGLELPFGTPSGLDQGGVSAALRDYMRIYPASPQLRIGLAAPSGGERYAETDAAIIAASGDLLAQHGSLLPGGVRIFDSSNRKGKLPSAVSVLRKILPEALHAQGSGAHAPFEWTTDPAYGPASSVDLQFIEDTIVHVGTEEIIDEGEVIGTSGPSIPFSRFRSWRADQAANDVSSFALGLQSGSFSGLPSFSKALTKVETLMASGNGIKLTSELHLGESLLGDHARWTITGNRHLDPSVLSSQLRRAPGDIALWEWRPAFLSRESQKSVASSIASTHPYTVLAKPSRALNEEVTNVLNACGMSSSQDDVQNVIRSLGTRGVGLSSLLTMGHTQSLGAIGFWLAFESLEQWELDAGPSEVRCVVPMDAVYPLIDLLGVGARKVDDQRRADLLLLSAQLIDDGTCTLRLNPVEVKMRSVEGGSFPSRGSTKLTDPEQQLDATERVLSQIVSNFDRGGSSLSLANGALATLVESAFSLRTRDTSEKIGLESAILEKVAAGESVLSVLGGTLLWFQVKATGAGEGMYESRPGNAGKPNHFFANPACFDKPHLRDEVRKCVASIIESGGSSIEIRPPDTQNVSDNRSSSSSQEGGNRETAGPVSTTEPTANTGQAHGAYGEVTEENGVETQPDEGQEGNEPADLPLGIEVLVGHRPNGTAMEPVYFKPSETALNQLNVGVVGDLGTGKTQFLLSLVYQLTNSAASNRGHQPKIFVFDYKRDYSERGVPEALGAQVLDPAKEPLPINFFALGSDAESPMEVRLERVRRANFFCDLLRRISGIGQVQRNDLYSSIMRAYESCAKGCAPSINDVFDVYSELGKSDSVVSVLTLLRDLMIFEPNPNNTTTFKELFSKNTVLKLSGISGAGQDIVDIVATMFLDHLYTDYLKTLPKEPFIEGPDGISRRKVDSFVLIDEAHHAMGRDFDVLMKLMLEGREFGMGVVLSSQFLSHFESGKHDWGEALSTWVVHNVRNAKAKQFERIGFRRDVAGMEREVTGLETHWAYYRCVNGYNEGILMKGQPFFSLKKD